MRGMPKMNEAEEAVEAAEDAARAARRAAANGVAKNAEPKDVGPLFSLEGQDAERHDRTRVYRVEPVDEGHLDDVPPDADRKDIRRRWGGGVYKVQAVTERGRIIATDGNVKISGEPIFDNEVARKRYAKWLEQQFGKEEAPKVGDDVGELRHRRDMERLRLEMELKEAAEERRRIREREEREAAEEKRRQEAREEREREREERRAEAEAKAAAEERRWRAEQEERRLEREERREAERAAAAQAKDPMQMLMTGMKLAAELNPGGEGYPDAGTAFVANLDKILESVRGIGTDIAAAGATAKPNPSKRPARVGGPEPVTLDDNLAKQAYAAVANLKKQGVNNPEQALAAAMSRTFNTVASMKRVEGGKPKPAKVAPRAAAKKLPPKSVKKTAKR